MTETSSHSCEHPIPPSDARRSAAAHKGLFPRSSMLNAGVVMLCIGGLCYFSVDHFIARLLQTIQDSLSASTEPTLPLKDAMGLVYLWFLPIAGVAVVAGVAATLIPALSAKKKSGTTAIPLPNKIRDWGTPLTTVGVGLLLLLIVIQAVRGSGFTFAEVTAAPEQMLRRVLHMTALLIAEAGALFIFGGAIQLSLYKAALLKQLSVSERDAAREHRLHNGDRRTKSRFRQLFGK